MNSLILLTILAAIVLIFIYQTRREIRQKLKQASAQASQEVRPLVVAKPAREMEQTPPTIALEVMASVVSPPAAAMPVVVKKLKKQSTEPKRGAKPSPLAAPASPIATVRDLLQRRDSLATAFVLSEIFAGPRSRQRRS